MPQEEVLDSSPSFSPSSGVSCDVQCSAGDGSASLISDSRPLRSRIPVKHARVGDLQLPLVSLEETALMMQHLKGSLPMSMDDPTSGRIGSSQRSRPFTLPLPPWVSTRSG